MFSLSSIRLNLSRVILADLAAGPDLPCLAIQLVSMYEVRLYLMLHLVAHILRCSKWIPFCHKSR